MRATRLALPYALFACGLLVLGCTDDGVRPLVEGTVTIAEDEIVLVEGGEARLTVSVTDLTGASLDVSNVRWSSSDNTTADVTSGGVVVGLAPGIATLWADAGSTRDSVRVTVEFAQLERALAARIQGAGGVRVATDGTATIRQNRLPSGESGTLIWTSFSARLTEAAGPSGAPAPSLGDTLLSVGIEGLPTVGTHKVAPATVEQGPNGELLLLGGGLGHGLLAYHEEGTDRTNLFIPVDTLRVDIESVELPSQPGLDGGVVRGRVAFEAAGLIVEHGAGYGRVVGQVADTTVQVYAQFEMPLLRWELGLAEMSFEGIDTPFEPLMTGAVSGMVSGALRIRSGVGFRFSGSDEFTFVDLFLNLEGAGNGTFSINDVGAVDLEDLDGLPATNWGRLLDRRGVEPFTVLSEARFFATGGAVTIEDFRSPTRRHFGHAKGSYEVTLERYDGGARTGDFVTVRSNFFAALPPEEHGAWIVPEPLTTMSFQEWAGHVAMP